MPKTGLEATDITNAATLSALDIIRKNGYQKLRLTDVAKSMNISHAALYKYFSSKNDLLDSVNSIWLHGIDESLDKIAQSDLPIVERIKEWAIFLHTAKKEKLIKDTEPYDAFIAATSEEREYIKTHLLTIYTQLHIMIVEAIENNIIKGDADIITKMFISTLHDFHHPLFIKLNIEEDRVSFITLIIETLFAGLRRT
jgi:AcrR family transcriptional regulator